jgi:citrate synthase
MYLSAHEAADELGVSVATLYAYVRRKQIRSQRIPGSKNRLYWQEDIERVKGHGTPPSADLLVPETSITLLVSEGPCYRGRSAIRLADTETFESVCDILWGPSAHGAFAYSTFKATDLYDRLLAELAGAGVLTRAGALLPILERMNPRAHDLSPGGYCRSGAEIIRWFAGLICDAPPAGLPIHEALAEGLHAPPGYVDIIRRVLVITADHELDPSTYAVRALANTGVSAYQLIAAGLSCVGGRRLSFGRSNAISQMVAEILTASDPAEPIRRRLQEGEPIYGFGSRVYPKGDPRASALLRWISQVDPHDPEFKRLETAIQVATDATDQLPDLVTPLTFVTHKLGLRERGGSLFRLARMAGWVAHAVEQYHTQDLVRPRTNYVGVLPELEAGAA